MELPEDPHGDTEFSIKFHDGEAPVVPLDFKEEKDHFRPDYQRAIIPRKEEPLIKPPLKRLVEEIPPYNDHLDFNPKPKTDPVEAHVNDLTMQAAAAGVEDYQKKARRLVYEYVKPRMEKTDTHVLFFESDVYLVWFCKTLQNWKALVSTTLPDAMYYEVTYDGEKKRTYIDAYKKFDNDHVVDY